MTRAAAVLALLAALAGPALALASTTALAAAETVAVPASRPAFVSVSQAAGLLTGHDATGAMVGKVALDRAPAVPVVTADGGRAYVSQPDLGTIAVVDLATWSRGETLTVGGQPFGLALTRDGRLLIADWSGNRLVEIRLADGATRAVPVGHAPSAVVLSADEAFAYTIDRESDAVSVVDLATLQVTATIDVGRAPFAAALAPDGRRLFVANVQSADLSVIDLRFAREIARVPIGGMPYGVAIDPASGRVAVTDQEGGRLVFVEARSLALGGVATVGDYAEGVAVLSGGVFAVANWFSDSLTLVDPGGSEPVRHVPVPEGPRMLAVVPQ